MSKFNISNIYKELDELCGVALTILFIGVLVPLFCAFLFTKITEGRLISHESGARHLNFTIGYAETVDSEIEFYGKNTNKELPLSACETGICFGFSDYMSDFTLQSDILVTGSNECTDSWAANVRTTLQIPSDKGSIVSKITGQKKQDFLEALQKSNNLFKYKNPSALFPEKELLPIFVATGEQIFNAFYQKEKHGFDKFSNDFEKNIDATDIGSVIKDTFKSPYKKSIDAYSNQISDQVLLSVPGSRNVTTVIQGFTETGDIDTGSLLKNVALKESFDCQ